MATGTDDQDPGQGLGHPITGVVDTATGVYQLFNAVHRMHNSMQILSILCML